MEEKDLFDWFRLFCKLAGTEKPLWGIMTPHHLLEHLSASVRMSNGGIYLQQAISDEQIPARLAFLYSQEPFPRNLRNVALPTGELRPLKTATLSEARELLEKMLLRFESHFAEHPLDQPIHPLFGPLNFQQWKRFHHRHMEHHATQFGLISTH